jgi:putative sugar O-methyltransferase
MNRIQEETIIERIEEDLRLQKNDTDNTKPEGLDRKWDFLISNEPQRFINQDLTIKKDILRNFRRYTIFIPDEPTYNPVLLNPKNIISGRRRGIRKLLRECSEVIKQNSYEYLLEKYPCNSVGNPYFIKYNGYKFTYRWAKHIYSLGLFNRVLRERINSDFIHLDIGSSYGIFSYLLRNEYPKCTTILLDFPEQLILAYYFLGMSLPSAKIAGYKEIKDKEELTRDFLKRYDVVLLPWFFYQRLIKNSIDLITNFASFGEMKRQWFEYYTKNEPFLSTKYFFTENRFQSAPTYDTDLTILDYPLKDFKVLHFGICPVFSHTYRSKYLIFSERLYFSSQYFEFLGERND